ncbi:MAG: hypothetical protein SGJ23_06795 [Alphaproteobacteria bacterium]|nr:hypothetical protein [Alphaproteobacteria bacterium]
MATIQLIWFLASFFAPSAIFQNYGGWFVAAWFVTVIWWFGHTSVDEVRTVEAYREAKAAKKQS